MNAGSWFQAGAQGNAFSWSVGHSKASKGNGQFGGKQHGLHTEVPSEGVGEELPWQAGSRVRAPGMNSVLVCA